VRWGEQAILDRWLGGMNTLVCALRFRTCGGRDFDSNFAVELDLCGICGRGAVVALGRGESSAVVPIRIEDQADGRPQRRRPKTEQTECVGRLVHRRVGPRAGCRDGLKPALMRRKTTRHGELRSSRPSLEDRPHSVAPGYAGETQASPPVRFSWLALPWDSGAVQN
jgi:hypothetical protein